MSEEGLRPPYMCADLIPRKDNDNSNMFSAPARPAPAFTLAAVVRAVGKWRIYRR